jgi:hypothetical protein
VAGEFGDDPSRYADAKSGKNSAGTSPVTKASGITKVVVARFVRNRRLGDGCYLWALAALSNCPGARVLYDAHRAKQQSHDQALRAVANRLVGILHACLEHHALYDTSVAWPSKAQPDTAAA